MVKVKACVPLHMRKQNIATHFLIRIFHGFINHWQLWDDEISFPHLEAAMRSLHAANQNIFLWKQRAWGELNFKKQPGFGQKA